MTSTDDSDQRAEVRRRRSSGETVRAIAQALGLSKSKVGRMAAELDDDAMGVEYGDQDDDEDLDYEAALARLDAMDSGQPVVEPITYVGVQTTVTEVKGWDTPQTYREMRYVDCAGHSLSVLDLYRYGQQLQQSGKWTEAAELTAALDAQHAQDDELVLTFDMLGGNPAYQPRESEAVDPRWTVGPPLT